MIPFLTQRHTVALEQPYKASTTGCLTFAVSGRLSNSDSAFEIDFLDIVCIGVPPFGLLWGHSTMTKHSRFRFGKVLFQFGRNSNHLAQADLFPQTFLPLNYSP